MDAEISKGLEALTLSKDHEAPDSLSWLVFTQKGSIGRAVFREHIIPYLTLDDLVIGAVACRQMNALCRTYTVGEILVLHSMEHVSRHHRMELGKLIIGSISQAYSSNRVQRRLVQSREQRFWARLYHPSAMEEIVLAMYVYFNRHGIEFNPGLDEFDWDANANDDTPLLVSASFGDAVYGTVDVTAILRYLLMKQGNTRLILRPPSNAPRYWYIYLFGDPCPHTTKSLRITVRTGVGDSQVYFSEDERVNIRLRASRID